MAKGRQKAINPTFRDDFLAGKAEGRLYTSTLEPNTVYKYTGVREERCTLTTGLRSSNLLFVEAEYFEFNGTPKKDPFRPEIKYLGRTVGDFFKDPRAPDTFKPRDE